MTDQELLRILEEKGPQELSRAELELLKSRLAASPELREALGVALQLDGNLAAALGRLDLSAEQVMARAMVEPRRRHRRIAATVASAAIVLLAAVVVGTLQRRTGEDENAGTKTVAKGDGAPAASADTSSETNSQPPATTVSEPSTSQPSPAVDNAASSATTPAPIEAPPAVPTPPVVPPWQPVLAENFQPPRFADVCFESFDVTKSLPQRDDLQKWFEPVAGQSLRIADTRTALGPCATFEGLVRLKAPLGADLALRLAMENFHRLQIHCFHGEQGVTLTYHEDDSFRWSAYNTTREAGSPLPKTWALSATDDNRNRRTEIRFGGPWELRHHEREIVLSRGDVVLLRAPLAGAPTDVYFSGRATFHGIALLRTRDFPIASEQAEQAIAREFPRPADLTWKEELGEGARVEKPADGSLRLRAEGAKARGWVSAPLPNSGLHEVILQLDDVQAGAGISLSRENERPALLLRFLVDKRTNGLCLMMRPDDDAREETLPALGERFVPLTTRSPWIKLVAGPGLIRWWISVDGVHWAEWQQPIANVPAGVTRLGLHHVAGAATSGLTLKSIVLRPLDAIAALADPLLVERAPMQLDAKDFESWSKTVLERKPADVSPVEWRRACAIRTLATGCPKSIALPVITFLLNDALERDRPWPEQLRLADQLMRFCDLRESALFVTELVRFYHGLGAVAVERQVERPFTLVRHALLAAPLHTPHAVPLAAPALIRTELLLLLYGARWQQAVEFCRQLRFYRLHEQVPLIDWADGLARRESPGRESPDPVAVLQNTTFPRRVNRRPTRGEREAILKQKAGWQHPYVEELSKETYNTVAELQGILDSAAYEDAAKMIAGLNADLMTGVAPTADDDRLLVSLPAAIRLAVTDHVPLQAAMDEKFGAIAQLRVRQAINAGNVAAVELAAVQFAATSAAAEARQWLGDRALSMGWFARAMAEYRRASITAGPGLRAAIDARSRLAAAMLGADVGQPVTGAVNLGERPLSAAEFEALVADVRQRESVVRAEKPGSMPRNPVDSAPAMGAFTPRVHSQLDGPLGDVPQEEVTKNVNRFKVDWAGRQIAAVTDGEWLIVSNRFQVAAYDLRNGQRLWQTTPPPGLKSRKARDWTCVPMRPLVTAQHVFVRQLYGDGPVLCCLEKQTGKMLWFTGELKNQLVASDPLFVQDRLFALTMARSDQLESTLRLSAFDLETGEITAQHDLINLRSGWQARHVCEVTALDDALVANLGGVTVCCDTSGMVRWIRKQVVMPPDEESEWITQSFDPPLWVDGRLLLAAPGVRSIDCVQPETGKLLWTVVMPDVRRVMGADQGRLFVVTDAGIQARSVHDGSRIWSHPATELLAGQLCGGAGGCLFARVVPGPAGKKPRPELVFLDSQTGQVRSTVPLESLEDDDPRMGPFLNINGRIWTFFGRGANEPKRDLVELVPAS